MATSLALGAWGLDWGVPARKGWAPDELLPQDVLAGRARRFAGGWHERYPPLQYRLLALAYSPWLSEAELEPHAVLPLELHGRLTLVGRLVSLGFWAGLLSSVYACGLRILTRRAALIACMLVALILPLVFYAKLANLEVPYLCWWAASLPLLIRAVEGRRGPTLPLLALLAALSVTTKDQAYALFVLLPVPILAARLSRQPGVSAWRRLGAALWTADVGLAALVGLATFCLVHGLPGNWSGFRAHVETMLAAGRSFRQFPDGLPGQIELMRAAFANLAFCLGWPAVMLALGGLLHALRRPRDGRLLALLAPIVSQHLFFLAPLLYCYDRFMLPAAIVLAFFAARWADHLLTSGGWGRPLGALALAAALALGLSKAVALDLQMQHDGRYEVERWLTARVRPGEAVGRLAPTSFLPRLKLFELGAVGPDLGELERTRPRWLMMNVAYSLRSDASDAERAFVGSLGRDGYRPAFEHRYALPWPLSDLSRLEAVGLVSTNLEKVNPLMRVYERAEP